MSQASKRRSTFGRKEPESARTIRRTPGQTWRSRRAMSLIKALHTLAGSRQLGRSTHAGISCPQNT